MHALELKIAPPIVALLVAAAMWGIPLVAPSTDVSAPIRLVAAIAIALAGLATAILGAIAFRRAKTTVSPLNPENASSLVISGVYRFARNPMYVGVTLVLVAWAVFLCSTWTLLGPLTFMLYITYFQIIPEERILAGIFGDAYSAYQAKVRRWL